MSGASRKGDKTLGPPSGHNWLPTPSIEGSPDVIINNKAAIRVGDHFAVHNYVDSTPPPYAVVKPVLPHDSVAAQGSPTVFVNGKALVRIGDQTSCSDTVAEGSSDVIVGDGPFPAS